VCCGGGKESNLKIKKTKIDLEPIIQISEAATTTDRERGTADFEMAMTTFSS